MLDNRRTYRMLPGPTDMLKPINGKSKDEKEWKKNRNANKECLIALLNIGD